MSFQLIISSGTDVFDFNIPPDLTDLVSSADTTTRCSELSLGEPIECDVNDILREVMHLRSALKEQEVVKYNYKTGMYFMGEPPYEVGAGGVSGFKIDGLPAGVFSGYDFCELTLFEVNEDGTTKVKENRDIRNHKEIQTDDWGVIKIIKRKASSSADRWLANLIKKLKTLDGKVTICFA